ncbi:hypothetical protein LINGRAHAP2_LOCUS2012 [Linum grandiflorum]
MRMVFRFQLICLQVQQPKRNLSLKLENPSLYESKISSPGEMAFDSNTPEDFNSGFKENNRLKLSPFVVPPVQKLSPRSLLRLKSLFVV